MHLPELKATVGNVYSGTNLIYMYLTHRRPYSCDTYEFFRTQDTELDLLDPPEGDRGILVRHCGASGRRDGSVGGAREGRNCPQAAGITRVYSPRVRHSFSLSIYPSTVRLLNQDSQRLPLSRYFSGPEAPESSSERSGALCSFYTLQRKSDVAEE